MAAVVGFAFLVTVATPVGKRVFLLVITTIPNAMLCMTTTAATVQKAACGRKKSPAYAGKKTITMERPLSGSPQGEMTVLTTLMARIWKLRINNVLLHTNKR